MKKENIHRASQVKGEIDRIDILLTGELIVKLPGNFYPDIYVNHSREIMEKIDKERKGQIPYNKTKLSGTMGYGIDFEKLVKEAIEGLGNEIRNKIQDKIEEVIIPLKKNLEKELDELLKDLSE